MRKGYFPPPQDNPNYIEQCIKATCCSGPIHQVTSKGKENKSPNLKQLNSERYAYNRATHQQGSQPIHERQQKATKDYPKKVS